ncbi:hypothetical protein JHK82_031926 [Glycine max]|nr:hypothetical protein JHK85_032591 [Glycine max]KAG4995198.1 hypothetical protein JHK86_032025 [Glycine max]KAG5125189.1 hypothetical protein JHK82_031926 [Glycine max]KAG5146614.1 hypothetical protein JHK84_032157 [Glycine max]
MDEAKIVQSVISPQMLASTILEFFGLCFGEGNKKRKKNRKKEDIERARDIHMRKEMEGARDGRRRGSKLSFSGDNSERAKPRHEAKVVDVDLSLLEAIEKSQSAVEALDLRALKKHVLSFERRLKENIEARLKYPNQPDRFADSEVELHEELQKLKVLASAPEFYPDLVSLNVVPSIVDLLNHDNTDIAIDVVQLLQDLTNEDVLDDNDDSARVLVDALVENSALELLVQNLHRLNDSDPDKNAAVYGTLATVDNMLRRFLAIFHG